MGKTAVLRHALVALLGLLCAAPGGQRAAEQAVVWYRGSADCPSGSDFLAMLGERGRWARLANAGDHIDFVVTVAQSGQLSHGRLERQTQAGTVAMREFEDESCDEVAAALALGLGLALESPRDATDAEVSVPPSERETTSAPPAAVAEPNARPTPTAGVADASAPPLASPAPATADRAPPRTASSASDWWLAAQGGVLMGITPSALAQAAVFVERESALAQVLPGFAWRAGALGMLGSVESDAGRVRHWVLAGRGEVCPLRLGSGRVGVWPCLALDLGATGASGTRSSGTSDTVLWSAVGVGGRFRWQVAGPVAVEAELLAVMPVTHYGFYAGSERVYETAPIGVSSALGAIVGLP